MVVVENDVVDSFQLRNKIQRNDRDKVQSNINNSRSGGDICDPHPIKSNMIYHQKVRRKDSLSSSYSSLEIHRIRAQDPNLLNRPAWTDARIALLQIKKVMLFIMTITQF